MGNANVQREYRIDLAGAMPSASQRSDGALVLAARLARTGVQEYLYASGKRVREQRDAAEVFASDSLASFRGLALTDSHPGGAVDPTTWRAVAVGHVGDDVRRDGKYVAATLYIQDAGTIAKLRRGDLLELSAGYNCTMVEGAGVNEDGERYDSRQVSVRGNHVALLPKGGARGGPELRVQLDHADSVAVNVNRIQRTLWAVRDRIKSGLLGREQLADLADFEDVLLAELRNL